MTELTFRQLTTIVCGIGLVFGMGVALLLSHLRWFSRIGLASRIQPFLTTQQHRGHVLGRYQQIDIRLIFLRWLTGASDNIARLLGIDERLEDRLLRAGSTDSAQTFRLRQISYAGGAFGIALLLCLAAKAQIAIASLFVTLAASLTFLILEQSVSQQISRNRERLFLELPVVAEQLATLLGAGYSLGAAIRRCAQRNSGMSGQALRRVTERTQQGVPINQALQEWAVLMQIAELHQLVAILSLNDDTTELARLISSHARNLRTEAQRRRIEMIESRGQQVWVPVTVATLVPGVIFILVPFLQALRLLSGS